MQNSIKLTATALVGFLLSNSVLAQDTYIGSTAKTIYTSTATQNAKISATNANEDVVATYQGVMGKFSSMYPGATSPQWTTSQDNLWVSFLHNGRKSSASFNLKGKMNYVILDCGIDQLPAAFSNTIKKEYASYSLCNAIQIKAHDAVAYQVVLENSASFLTLKYTSEGVEEVGKVTKTTK